VVDTETTGLDAAAGHRVVEIATILITDGVIGDAWSTLVRPGRPIPADASVVHGIDDAMVADAPAPDAAAAELRRRCGDHPLVFHNASFDLPFLRALLRAGASPPLFNPVIDTLGLARGFPGPGGNSLEALAARYGLPPDSHHRAGPDALRTARLLIALATRWEQERGVRSLDELAAISQDALRRERPRPQPV
jgi:DNA polymerase-3 subunit epsilon